MAEGAPGESDGGGSCRRGGSGGGVICDTIPLRRAVRPAPKPISDTYSALRDAI